MNLRNIATATTCQIWLNLFKCVVCGVSAIFLQIQFEKSIAMSAPVVISLVEIVEKGQPSLAGMFSPPRNSSLNFSQLQLQLSHDIQSWLGEKVARIVFICIHSPVGRGAGWRWWWWWWWWRCAISSSQLKCIRCSDSASYNWWENISNSPGVPAQPGQGHVWAVPVLLASEMSLISSDLPSSAQALPWTWPADLNWILCSVSSDWDCETETDRQTGPWYLLSLRV